MIDDVKDTYMSTHTSVESSNTATKIVTLAFKVKLLSILAHTQATKENSFVLNCETHRDQNRNLCRVPQYNKNKMWCFMFKIVFMIVCYYIT